MESGDISSAGWTYEKADQLSGNDWVTLYFHETRNLSVQTKITLDDPAAAVAWAAEHGFPDPTGDLGPAPGSGSVLRR